MKRKDAASKDPKTQAFIRHLEKVSKEVDNWPQWKKDVMNACPDNSGQAQRDTGQSDPEMTT